MDGVASIRTCQLFFLWTYSRRELKVEITRSAQPDPARSPMLWILSTLRILRESVRPCTDRAFLPLLFVIASALGGAACRGDDTNALPAKEKELDDSDASSVAGAIQGSFAVSSTGEATYVIPLIVPPGAAGMQPSPAVAYDSASGDGMLGMGVSLTGLSAITRCPLTIAQDNQIRSVRYDQNDSPKSSRSGRRAS